MPEYPSGRGMTENPGTTAPSTEAIREELRADVLKDYAQAMRGQFLQELLAELDIYKAAFSQLHTFVGGVSIQKHGETCPTKQPYSSEEIRKACVVCEADMWYKQYAWLPLSQMVPRKKPSMPCNTTPERP